LCLILFISFLGVLLAIFLLSLSTGDWQQYAYASDYVGNRCGVDTCGSARCGRKAFYPRIPQDMLMPGNRDIVAAGNVQDFRRLNLYAVCVDTCPGTFDIDNPTPSLVADYGYLPATVFTQSFGSGTQAQWLAVTPTVDIFNRCIPRATSNQAAAAMCAYPKCTSAEAIAVGAVCANTPGFTNGEWEVCPESGSGDAATCAAQTAACLLRKVNTETTTFELATSNAESEAMLSSVADVMGGFFEIMASISQSIVFIVVGGVAVPFALAFAYMLLLFFFAKIIIYALLILMCIAMLLATFVCFSRSGISFQGVSGDALIASATAAANVSVPDIESALLASENDTSRWMYSVGFLVMAIVTAITIFTVITARKKIAICAAIVKEATTVFATMPMMMFFPALSTIMQILAFAWFLISIALVRTSQPEALSESLGLVVNTSSAAFISAGLPEAAPYVDPIGSLRSLVENPNYVFGATFLVIFGLYVTVQFIMGMAWCTMSGATYYWYFFKDDEKEKQTFPIARSLGRNLFFHSGSVAFAAFIIATVDLIRTIAAYVEKQMEATGANNALVKLAFKALQCCLYCLKRTIKFISYYGLVFVSCQGSSFCMGCYKTFFFFLKHPGQVSINATVTFLLRIIAMLSTPLFCGVIFFYILDATLEPRLNAMYPAFIIFVTSAVVITSCMTVFDCTITTIFVACFQDKQDFGGKFMSDNLAAAFGMKKKADDAPAKVEV